jgi:predicted transglutaminase-like cysteine proteinase
MGSRRVARSLAISASLCSILYRGDLDAHAANHHRTMQLPVTAIVKPPLAYVEFCDANPGHCDMTGSSTVELTPEVENLLSRVTRDVNAAFRCVPDWVVHGVEEKWSYPRRGVADCEDFALEKRRRLVELGLPRAALTIAIAYHRRTMSPHALLLVETHAGTYVLDNLMDEVLLWSEAAYNFEARERTDGQWERFDQAKWIFE